MTVIGACEPRGRWPFFRRITVNGKKRKRHRASFFDRCHGRGALAAALGGARGASPTIDRGARARGAIFAFFAIFTARFPRRRGGGRSARLRKVDGRLLFCLPGGCGTRGAGHAAGARGAQSEGAQRYTEPVRALCASSPAVRSRQAAANREEPPPCGCGRLTPAILASMPALPTAAGGNAVRGARCICATVRDFVTVDMRFSLINFIPHSNPVELFSKKYYINFIHSFINFIRTIKLIFV